MTRYHVMNIATYLRELQGLPELPAGAIAAKVDAWIKTHPRSWAVLERLPVERASEWVVDNVPGANP